MKHIKSYFEKNDMLMMLMLDENAYACCDGIKCMLNT